MAESELTREDLRRLSAELDSTGQVTLPEPKSDDATDQDVDDAGEDSSASQEELESKFKRERKEKGEKSKVDDDEDEEPDSDSEDEEEEKSSESSAESRKIKDKERQDRSWKKLEEEKRALREEKEKFEAERKNGSAGVKRIRTVDDVREVKDGNGYSVADYEYAAKRYEDDGESEKAEKLKAAAQELFVKTFSAEWTRNTNELIEEHPELSDSRKPLTQAVNKCLESLPFLKMVPDGIRYAVRIALGDSSSEMLSELQTENRKLKKQLERASRRTRLVGSGPSRGGETTFEGQDVLSLPKDRRKAYLRELAAQADGSDNY